MSRPIAETLRAIADRLDALPAGLPDPTGVELIRGKAHVRWSDASAATARSVLTNLPGEWRPSETFMYRSDDSAVAMWWIYLHRPAVPPAVVDPAELLAEVAS